LAELIDQLQKQEKHCFLVVVDQFNWMYRPSGVPAYEYMSWGKLKGMLPPYHMALMRLFMKLDGHKIKNGYKIVASSNQSLYKHVFTPEKINFPMYGFSHEMTGMELDTLRAFCQYYHAQNWPFRDKSETAVQVLWLEQQGNWQEIFKIMRMPFARRTYL